MIEKEGQGHVFGLAAIKSKCVKKVKPIEVLIDLKSQLQRHLGLRRLVNDGLMPILILYFAINIKIEEIQEQLEDLKMIEFDKLHLIPSNLDD